MDNYPKIFIVILNYNGAKTLPNCLAAVFQSNYSNFEVVVVDNNSTDDSFEKARLQYSRAHFIKNSTNAGFAKGNNLGIRYALEKFADFIFILNNDANIEKDTLLKLIQTFKQNNRAGIISPLIFDANNKIWFAGGKINWFKMKTQHIFQVQAILPYSSQYLSGCAMLIKKEVFKKIGLFDERFFLYYEDTDFSLRATQAGFDLLIDPQVHIQHLEQSNMQNGAKIYWLVLSGLIFFFIHASFWQKIWLHFYLTLRKIKNFYNSNSAPNETTQKIKKAYTDYKKVSL